MFEKLNYNYIFNDFLFLFGNLVVLLLYYKKHTINICFLFQIKKGSRGDILAKKKLSNFIFLTTILVIIWIIYYVQAYQLFAEIKDFSTEDASYIVRILEFTNFRGSQLSLLLIEYFILISFNNIFCLFIYKKTSYNKKKTLLGILLAGTVVLVGINCIIANIFWSVYLLITVLSFLIVLASIQISNLIWGSTVKFNKGDVVFYSDAYETEKIAKDGLNKKLKQITSKNISNLSTDVFQIDDEYFFEIYADDIIILDNKGEFIINEEI